MENKIENSNQSSTTKESISTFGFKNTQDLLDEINYRFSLTNRNIILLKKLPKKLTRISLKDFIPEMINCRFPEESKNGNKGYAFIQFANENALVKNLEALNKKEIWGKKLVATRLETNPKTDIDEFDLKKLYFNGLTPNTKYREIKEVFPTAKIHFPMGDDKLPVGSFTLTFPSEAEAMAAFVENKLTLHGVKCHLNFLLKPSGKLPCKLSFESPEDILAEIKNRFETQSSRTVIIKNLPNGYTLPQLRQLASTMRNCKINCEKKIGFIDFATPEQATEAAKQLNSQLIDGSKIRAFVTKEAFQCSCLTAFELNKIHLTNLPIDVTETDIRSKLHKCNEIVLHKNSDDTCIGTATVSFGSNDEALAIFARGSIRIKEGLEIGVNFHLIKTEITVVAGNKRPLDKTDDDSIQDDTEKIKMANMKLAKTSELKKPVVAHPVKKILKPAEKIAAVANISDKNKSLIPKKQDKPAVSVEKPTPKSGQIVNSTKTAATKTVEVTKPMRTRMSQTKMTDETAKKSAPVVKEDKKSKLTKPVVPITRGKRTLDQIESENIAPEITKKTRVFAKSAIPSKTSNSKSNKF